MLFRSTIRTNARENSGVDVGVRLAIDLPFDGWCLRQSKRRQGDQKDICEHEPFHRSTPQRAILPRNRPRKAAKASLGGLRRFEFADFRQKAPERRRFLGSATAPIATISDGEMKDAAETTRIVAAPRIPKKLQL